MRLINDEVINKYLVKDRVINGKKYEVFFTYVGESIDENDELLADIYSVGFITPEGVNHTGRVILPIVREDGLLMRNKSIWYPVTMVIPPIRYNVASLMERYFHTVVSLNSTANSVTDFMPVEMTAPAVPSTPLMREITPAKALDARNMWNWNALKLDVLIIEMINYKIVDDMYKSRKGGFTGISAAVKVTHTLLNAILRYKEGMTDWGKPDDVDESVSEDDIETLGRISVEDANSVVVVHGLVTMIDIEPNGPIDFCTCSPSIPMRTARIRDGVSIENNRFSGKPVFPYTKWRRAILGVTSDDPRRVIVSKSITRAMSLDDPDEPLAQTDYTLNVDSLSLPGIRMTHPLTHNDGIVVSETFAEKAGAFKIYIDKFMASSTAEVVIKKVATDVKDIRMYAKDTARLSGMNIPSGAKSVIKRGEVIADIVYIDETSTQVIDQYKSKVKSDSVVIKVERFIPETDMEEKGVMYRVISLAYLPLSVGDKLADAHGNKGTVSAIWADDEMPVIKYDNPELDRSAHYIAYPFVGKRLPVGAEIEDKIALANRTVKDKAILSGNKTMEMICIDSSAILTLDEADDILKDEGGVYLHKIDFDEKIYDNIPVSFRRMFRLDNHAVETVGSKSNHIVETGRRYTSNVTMGLDLVTMLTRGSKAIVDWLIRNSHSSEMMTSNIIPVLYAIYGTYPYGAEVYEIDKTLDRAMLGKVFRTERIVEEDFSGTVCDYRAETHYGIIRMGKEFIIIPPHKPVYQVNYGHSMVDSISKLANRVFAEYKSSCTEFREFTDVEAQVKRYKDTLCRHILGKDSIFRESLLPVFPTSTRAVATPYMGSNEFEIAIPRKEFSFLMATNESFRRIYSHRENHMCLIKRDPVHRGNNVTAVKFRLWDNNTIGVFPALMEGMDGDFDGDTVFALFPTEYDAHYDMMKMQADMSHLVPSKHISDVSSDQIYDTLYDRTGESSSFEKLHILDEPKNTSLFESLVNGIEYDELMTETMRAAKDFFTIKDGTARTGALGLTFIFTRSPEKSHILNDAMELYHMMAQNTLNAKAGVPLPALKIVSGAAQGKVEIVKEGLDELGYPDNECRKEFIEFVLEMKKLGGRTKFMASKSPVFGCIQKQAGTVSAVNLAKKFMLGKVSGEGVYDGLFDYITGRLETSPYQWADKEDVLTRRINMYTDKLKTKFEG